RSVDNRDRRQNHERNLIHHDGLGKEGERESNETVATHLQKNASENHATRSRGLNVRIRQPSVQRKERHLDREGQGKSQEQETLTRHESVAAQLQLIKIQKRC